MKLRHGTYIGDIPELVGKKALIHEGWTLEAQFDDTELEWTNPQTGLTYSLGFSWHGFPPGSFAFDDECEPPATEKDTMRFPNDISRPLDGADNLNISVAVPGHKGSLRWRAGRALLDGPLKDTFDALLRYLIDLDLEQPVESALLVPDAPPGRTVLAVIRHEDREPRSVRFELVDCQLQMGVKLPANMFAEDGA